MAATERCRPAMIECRTKGIPMREGTRVDAEGYHHFSLDEGKHDPFMVLQRLIDAAHKATGIAKPVPSAESESTYQRVLRKLRGLTK